MLGRQSRLSYSHDDCFFNFLLRFHILLQQHSCTQRLLCLIDPTASREAHILARTATMAIRSVAVRAAAAFRLRRLPPQAFFSTDVVLDDLKYSTSHEWVKVEGNHAVVGITHHAQEAMGDVVFVDLPEVGKQVSKGETFGVVESVKAVSDMYSPITGEVVEVNSQLLESPALVNKGPFNEGWMMKVKVNDPSEVQSLLDAEKYKQHVEEGGH